jgi:DNA alkylation repair enzyme
MGKPRVPIDPVADLKTRLADPRQPELRVAVQRWWADHGFADFPPSVGKRIALALIEQPLELHKRAGIQVLASLGPHLRTSDLPAFARLFAARHLAEEVVVDRFTARVLVTLLARVPGRREAVRALVQWRAAETCWQRRAACLAFLELAPRGDAALLGLVEQLLTLLAAVVWSPAAEDQSAVGCVLREVLVADPIRGEAFFRRHARLMTRPCARHAVAKLEPERRAALLAIHRRATTLRHG